MSLTALVDSTFHRARCVIIALKSEKQVFQEHNWAVFD